MPINLHDLNRSTIFKNTFKSLFLIIFLSYFIQIYDIIVINDIYSYFLNLFVNLLTSTKIKSLFFPIINLKLLCNKHKIKLQNTINLSSSEVGYLAYKLHSSWLRMTEILYFFKHPIDSEEESELNLWEMLLETKKMYNGSLNK